MPGYEILGELGRGGMGVVYKARQVGLNRLVALKVVLAGARAGPTERARFRAEAEAAARLRHPNIVQVHDVGEHDGCPFFTMELVEGPSLAEACRGRPQPARPAAALIEALARAIDCAHRQGVLHRDLKPANILLQPGPGRIGRDEAARRGPDDEAVGDLSAPGWVPKVVDFGLAKRLDDVGLTRDGLILGTPSYLAPEQATGRGGPPGPAVDIYALGAMFYELLTGRPPFLADSAESTLALVAREDPIPPRRLVPKVPRDLETICLACLAKDPPRRYAGALDLADDLRRFLAGEPIRARRQSPAERLVLWARRHREIAASVAAVLLLLVGCSVASLLAAAHFRRMEREQRRLALRNGALSRENEDERRRAELLLADMDTEHGLQASEFGRDREAVLWFARAAQVAASDPERRRANLLRARAWSRRVSRPVAVVRHPAGIPLTLEFHPGNRYLLSTPAPSGGIAVVWDLQEEQPLALPGGAGITAAAWSPDGESLALGTRDGVTLYAFPSLTGPRRIATDGGPTLLRFSRDGNRLAVATGPIVRVWDRRRGAFVTGRLAHPASVLSLEFTPDGGRLISADEGGQFRVFALGEGGSGPELTGRHQQYGGGWTLHAPRLDPTGTSLISVTAPSELTWWDLASGERVGSLSSLGGPICHVEPSRDGSLLAVSVEHLGVVIVDPAKREVVSRLHRGQGGLLFSAFGPDGRTIVAAGAHPEAQQWALPEGTWLGAPAVEATGFRAAAFSNDGRLVATAGYENQIRVWALPATVPGEFAVPTDGAVGRGTFSADSRLLLARLRGKTARVYRVADGSPSGPPLRPEGELIEAALAPDSRSVVTTSAGPDGGGLVDFWDWGTGRRRWPTVASPGPPIALAVSASGRVAVLGRDGLLLLLDATTGRAIREWRCGATAQPIEDVGVCLGADGRTVVVAINHHLQVWDGDAGRMHFDPPHHPDLVFAALSADGRSIASAGVDSTLQVWGAETGRRLVPAMVHPSWVDGGVDFHPDSRHVLTICKDMTMRVWDVAAGRLAAPPIRPASIGAARFSPDGRAIVSAGCDGTVEVWDWRAGRRLLPPRKLPLATDWAFAGNRAVQISPDGRFVAVGGRPEIHVLKVDDPHAIEGGSPEGLDAWAELLSHHRVHEVGTLAHLTGEEWLQLWHDLRRRQVRPSGIRLPTPNRPEPK
jgi:WD40 repeat protein